MTMKSLKGNFPYILTISAFIFFAYFGLPQSFFEQDEWHTFGYMNFLFSLDGKEFVENVLSSGPLTHFTPLSLFFKMGLYKLFGLNASLYFLVSLILHTLVSIVVYLLILILTKRKIAAFLGSLFFAIGSSHYQAVTWIGTFEGAQLSTFFGLLAIITLLVYLMEAKRKLFYFSLILIFIALLFKETALTFFLALLALIFFKEKKKEKVFSFIKIGVILLFYASLRFTYLLFGNKGLPAAVGEKTEDLIFIIGYNFLTLPIKLFTQVFFPNNILVYFANITSSPFGIYQYLARGPWVLENGFRYDLLSIPLGMVFLAVLLYLRGKVADKLPFYLGLALVFFTPPLFLPLKKYLVFFDSRYIYPATAGLSLVTGAIIASLKLKFRVLPVFLLTIFFIALLGHLWSLKMAVNQQRELGSTRESLVGYIKEQYPKLPRKTIFYTESDATYYGVPNILPFQSGFGQMLLVFYHPVMKYPAPFFKEDFLWDLNAQGYKEIEGTGFGYYRDFELLKKAMKKYNISSSSVIAFSWESQTESLVNISLEVRKRLQSEDDL